MAAEIIKASALSVHIGGRPLFSQLSFTIHKGACCAVTGPSGSGKTTLLNILAGRQQHSGVIKIATQRVVLVTQQHRFLNRSNVGAFYYQQRFNASEAGDAKTASETYPEVYAATGRAAEMRHSFGISHLEHKSLLHLSNGENKRLQLVVALLKEPEVLLLDAPFIGLDIATRSLLEERLAQLCKEGLTVVFSCAASQVPAMVTQVINLQQNEVHTTASTDNVGVLPADVLQLLLRKQQPVTSPVVAMHDVNIQYGGKLILQNVSWQINAGERWSLSGPNGAGKSTLLSLITADNPQAYANEVYLFGRKRGSGESIWDIKKQVGYVSPELHLHFEQRSSVFDVVASGLFDTIGLFRVLGSSQLSTVLQWLRLFHLEAYKSKLMAHLPLGIQRMALLARALIKCPPLLVLDEPLQGLDEHQAGLFNGVVEQLCAATDQTLIYVSHYAADLPRCITHHLKLESGLVVH